MNGAMTVRRVRALDASQAGTVTSSDSQVLQIVPIVTRTRKLHSSGTVTGSLRLGLSSFSNEILT